jgi:hypothetical protein
VFTTKNKRQEDSGIAPEAGFGLFKKPSAPKPAVVKRDFSRPEVSDSDIQDAIEVVPAPASDIPEPKIPPVFSGMKVTPRKEPVSLQEDPHTITMESPSHSPAPDSSEVTEDSPAANAKIPSSGKPFSGLFKKPSKGSPEKSAPFAKEKTPKEREVSVKVSSLMEPLIVGAAVLGVMGALLSGVYGYRAYATRAELVASLGEMATQKSKAAAEASRSLMNASKSFANTQTVLFNRAVSRAEQLWIPGTRVVLASVPGRDTYTVVALPKAQANSADTKGGSTDPTATVVTPALLNNIEMPQGCALSVPANPGDSDEIKITINCENNAGPFSDYWPS